MTGKLNALRSCITPAGVEEVVSTAAVESRPEKVEQNVLPQRLKPAIAGVDQILDVFVLVVQHYKLLQARHDRAQDARNLRQVSVACGGGGKGDRHACFLDARGDFFATERLPSRINRQNAHAPQDISLTPSGTRL